MINFNPSASFEERTQAESCVKTAYAIMAFFDLDEIINLRNKFVTMQSNYLSTIDSISQLIQLSVDALSVVQTEHTIKLFSERASRAIKTGIDSTLTAQIQQTMRKAMAKVRQAQENINSDYQLDKGSIRDESNFYDNGVDFNTSVHTNPDSAKLVFGQSLSEKLAESITSQLVESSKSDSVESGRYSLYERQLYEIFRYSDLITNLSSEIAKLEELYDSYQVAYLTVFYRGLNKRESINEFVNRPFLEVYHDIIMVARAYY